MSDHADVDDMSLLELQRERLKSARERQETLAIIRDTLATLANWSRWTAIAVAAHASVSIAQEAPTVPAVVRFLAWLVGAALPWLRG